MSSSAGGGHRSKEASLYVGNLPPNVTEAKLLEQFSKVGSVCSIRICRDKATRRFLGYAYVNFRRKEDATRALETINSQLIGGRTMRVMWPERMEAQPTPKPKQDKKKSAPADGSQDNPVGIFLSGLNPEIRDKDLHGIFSSSGAIVECGVGLDDSGNSKGFGYVQFETEEAVEKCLERVKSWLGSTLTVTKLYANVHVFNFGYRLNFGSMREMFGQYGAISVYRVVKNIGKCNGFGYVTFKKLKSAAYAVAELNGKDLGEGLKLKVESAPCPISERLQSLKKDEGVNLYVKIMEPAVTDERLQQLFSPFGPIISVKLLKGQSADGQRAGFVLFASSDDATRAIEEMHGKVVGTGPLEVKLAIAKKIKATPAPKSPQKTVESQAKSTRDPKQSEDQKRALSDRLFLVVRQLNASMAGSITAKLLELDSLPQLMTQPVALKAKVDETVVALLLNREQHLLQIEGMPAESAAA
uniref:Polyadenylate-binding protein 1-B n=2 Tax=Culex pipiens TaxID=7175 RepID=A0A8D8NBH8_CULPI